jgi:Ca2+-binding RTX toxin-like protein
LNGGAGSDVLYGQNGNDDLHGGDDSAYDYLNGGAGHDWFWYSWYDYFADFNSKEDYWY